jgi:hypothetical protein
MLGNSAGSTPPHPASGIQSKPTSSLVTAVINIAQTG